MPEDEIKKEGVHPDEVPDGEGVPEGERPPEEIVEKPEEKEKKPRTPEEIRRELAELPSTEEILERIGSLEKVAEERDALKVENNELKTENEELKERNEKLESQIEEGETKEYAEIKEVFQEKLNEFRKEAQNFLEEWTTGSEGLCGYQEHLQIEKEYNQACQDLGLEPRTIKGLEQTKQLNSEIESFYSHLDEIELKDFIIESLDLQSQFFNIKEGRRKLSTPWDSVIVNFFDELPETVKTGKIEPSKEVPSSLKTFANHRGFEIIWPQRGEELNLGRHRIFEELVNAQVKRRTIIQSVTPGLEKDGNVLVKAGIYLAK